MLDSIGEFYRTSSKTGLIIGPHLFGKEWCRNVRCKRIIASVHVQAAARVRKLYMVHIFTHSFFQMNTIILQPVHRAQPKPCPKKRRRDSIPRAHLGPGGVEFFQRDHGAHPCDDGLETITTPNECGTNSSASLLKPAQLSHANWQTCKCLVGIHPIIVFPIRGSKHASTILW